MNSNGFNRSIRNELSNVFGRDFIGCIPYTPNPWGHLMEKVPTVTEEVADGVHSFSIEVPGYKKTELQLEVQGSMLVISGERTVGTTKKTCRLVQSLNVNYDLSSIKAKLEDGIITISYGLQDKHVIEII